MVARNVPVPGEVPARNLLAHIHRDPRFRRATGRGVYALAEWDEPARPELSAAEEETLEEGGGTESDMDYDPFAEE